MKIRSASVVISVLLSFALSVGAVAGATTATLTALDASTVTLAAGKPLALTARVISATGIPPGEVNFYDGKTVLGTAGLNTLGLASVTVRSLAAGSHSLTAAYVSAAAFSGSRSTAVVVTITPAATAANTIHVPADQKTIQAAIDAASNGDTVLVAAGVYKEHIDFKGKAITVTSESSPAVTVIDGGGTGPVVQFVKQETRASVLSGFTIRNGLNPPEQSGAGIDIEYSSPSIVSNVVTGNAGCAVVHSNFGAPYIALNTIGDSSGAGFCPIDSGVVFVGGMPDRGFAEIVGNTIEGSHNQGVAGVATRVAKTVLIENNLIRNNTGGGILADGAGEGGADIIAGNVIAGNTAADPGEGDVGGGGIYILTSDDSSDMPIVVNNTIAGNSMGQAGQALSGPQIYVNGFYSHSAFWNNVIVGVDSGPAVYCDPQYLPTGPPPTFKNNDVFSPAGTAFGGVCAGAAGRDKNISADPKLVNPSGPDFSLLQGSPAIRAGNILAPNVPVYDLAGKPRTEAGQDGGLALDMGALTFTGAANAVISTVSLDFGALTIYKTSAAKEITVKNEGGGVLHILAIGVTGKFIESDTCHTASGIAPNSSCVIAVKFAPVTRGSQSGTLTIRSNAASSPQTVSLSGTATGAVASLSPMSLTFAKQNLFTSSTAQTLTLKNTGNDVLTVSKLNAPPDFVASYTCIAVAPGDSCAISVTFKPTQLGLRTGTLTVVDDATERKQTATLSGTGIGADITFSTPQITFPGTPVNTTSPPLSLTVSNHGEAALNLSYKVSGPFAAKGNCGTNLGTGDSCALQITFTPSEQGAAGGSITFTDNAAASPQRLSLHGIGGLPGATASPSPLMFPEQIVNTKGVAQGVALQSSGTAYLTITKVSVTGPFSQTNNCIGSVAAGEFCEVSVTFNPTATGQQTGSLTFTDDAGSGSQSVTLKANATSAHPVPTLATVSPQVFKAGSAETTLTITGTNFYSDSVVEWNGEPLQTYPASPTSAFATVPASLLSTSSEVTVSVENPSPGGGNSPAQKLNIFSEIPISARDMVYDATKNLLYVSTDTNSITHPDEVVSLDPATGEFGTTLLSGNQPGKLAITPDSKYLYIETDKSSSVTRIDLSKNAADLTFSLGTEKIGSLVALDIAPVPGNDSSVVIAIGSMPGEPSSYSVQEFENGKPQPTHFNRSQNPFLPTVDHLLFINSPNALYGGDTEDTGANLSVFSIGSGGLSMSSTQANLGGQLATDGKNIFVGSGLVISPNGSTQLASLPFYSQFYLSSLRNCVTVDPAAHEAFFGENNSDDAQYPAGRLYFVDTDSFAVLGTISFNEFAGSVNILTDHIVRYGENGIAFRSSTSSLTRSGAGSKNDAIILLQSSLAKSP